MDTENWVSKPAIDRFMTYVLEHKVFQTMQETDRNVKNLFVKGVFVFDNLLKAVNELKTDLSGQNKVDCFKLQKLAALIEMFEKHKGQYQYFCFNTMPDYQKCCQLRNEFMRTSRNTQLADEPQRFDS